jgi:phosphoribosylformylglycinamidine synthase
LGTIKEGLDSVSLSANWMWACKMKVKMRVYEAVQLVLISLSIRNQHSNRKRFAFDETKYPNDEVIAPGTVIISAAGNCSNITKVVEPTEMAEIFTT